MPAQGSGSMETDLLCLLAHPELRVLAQVSLQQGLGVVLGKMQLRVASKALAAAV